VLRGPELHQAIQDVFEDAMGILPLEGENTDVQRVALVVVADAGGPGLSQLEKSMVHAALAALRMLKNERELSKSEVVAALEAAPDGWMSRLVSLKWRYTYENPDPVELEAWELYQESLAKGRLRMRAISGPRAVRVDLGVGLKWASLVHLEAASSLDAPSDAAILRARETLEHASVQDLPPEMPGRLACLVRINRLRSEDRNAEVLAVVAEWRDNCEKHPDYGDPDEFLSEEVDAFTALERFDEAIAACRTLYTKREDHLDFMLEEARLLKDKEDFQGSLDACERYVALKPDDAEGYVARANAYYNLARYDLVERDAKRAIELDPTSLQAWLALGFAKLQANDPDAALGLFEYVLGLVKHPDAMLGKGKCLAMSDRYFEAMEIFKQTTDLDPENPAVYYEMADTLFLMGYFDESVKYATQCLALDPKFAGAYVVLGMIASRLRQDEKADRLIELALQFDPTNPFALNEKAYSLHSEGRDDEAMVCVDKAIEEFPTYSDAFCTRGMILYYKSDFDEALKMFDTALQYTPEHLVALTGKANVLVQDNDYDEAMRLYDFVLKQNPDFAEACSGKAMLLRLLGQEDEAREWTERANKAYGDDEDDEE